ncbi:MAG: hypothetical protein OXN17_23320 [Candidatus Poribacteria bacterium]|nr:hypothetical protein [Candidatus Poribacteria bacterium]MDE0505769.1 hypothetical protein [Candidatus Poribacteria bacterium]
MKKLSFSSAHTEQITWRSILISLFLLPFLYWWHITCEALPSFGPPPTLMAPFYTVVFVLLILAVANLTLKRFLPKNALTRGELISIYVFMSILGLFMSYDMFLPLVSIIVHAFYFASPENEWRDLFWSYLPDWLTINDSDAVRAFYLGDESIFEIRHFLAWLEPTFWWCTFTFVLLFVMQCINVIIRKRWVEQERLVYPIVELPHQIAYNTNSFLRNKPMWWGFAVAASISLINGLSVLFPSIPSIPNKSIPLHALFSEKPWTAFLAGGSSIIIYPFAVGLSFLMPLDLLGSCLLFFLLYKIQIFVGILIGLEKVPGYPYAFEQNIGAYTGISVIVLWTARRQIWRAFQQAIQHKPTEDAAEPMRYRTAFLGIVLGGIFLVGFGMRGGMALWIAVLFFAAHFLTIAIALTRIRAQIGLSIHNTTSIGPHHSLVSLIGSRRIGARNLTWFSLFFWFNRDNRSHPMPHQLEAFKLAERSNLESKGLSRWMLGLMVIAMPLCILMLLDTFYKLGVDSGRVGAQINSFGGRAYRLLHRSFITPQDSQPAHIAGMVIGFGFTLLLAAVRGRLFWWPIHPLGYGVAFHIHMFWAAFTISAIAKWSLLKYGGIGLYRKAVPLFIGLVLGDFTVGSIWSILGIALNTRTYTFYY